MPCRDYYDPPNFPEIPHHAKTNQSRADTLANQLCKLQGFTRTILEENPNLKTHPKCTEQILHLIYENYESHRNQDKKSAMKTITDQISRLLATNTLDQVSDRITNLTQQLQTLAASDPLNTDQY